MSRNEYWAKAPTEEIATEVVAQFDDYCDWLGQSGYGAACRQGYNDYHGFNREGSFGLEKSSSNDKVTSISVNHQRNLLQRIHILITQSKVTFLPRARNSDTRSQLESDLAKGALEYYQNEKALGRVLSKAVEVSLAMNESFVHCHWNMLAGHELVADGENVINSGDQDYEVLNPFQVARDPSQPTLDCPWKILKVQRNKWDMAALYTDHAEAIIAADAIADLNTKLTSMWSHDNTNKGDDIVDVYILYHAKTAALPKGRHTIIVGQTVVLDEALRYKIPPVFRLAAADVMNSIAGMSPGMDLRSLQMAFDTIMSAILSNNINGLKNNIYVGPPGADGISPMEVEEGYNLFTGATEPKAISFVSTPAESYKLSEIIQSLMQVVSGINATARGNPEASLKSGNSLALMLAQSIQFALELQKGFAQLASDVGTCTINNLQTFATAPMLSLVGGGQRANSIKEFKAQEIMNVDRVSVDLGNPITDTQAGRQEFASFCISNGIVKDPAKAIDFVRSGQVESLTDDKFKDSILIQKENELLKRGIKPEAVMWDDHVGHFLGHKELAGDPEARLDGNLMVNLNAHMQEHLTFLATMNPDISAILGIPPLPSQQQALMQAQQGGPPPQQGGGDPNAEVNGVGLPNVPPGTPPEVEANYNQAQELVNGNPSANLA